MKNKKAPLIRRAAIWQVRQNAAEEYRKSLYSRLRGIGEPAKHLAETDKACTERPEEVVSAIAKKECITEQLKAEDMLTRVRAMNNIRSRAEEIVLQEIIYNEKIPVTESLL